MTALGKALPEAERDGENRTGIAAIRPLLLTGCRGDGHFVGLPRVLDRICARAKLANVTVHTRRHSFGAAAAELGFSVLMIAGLLGHSVPGA